MKKKLIALCLLATGCHSPADPDAVSTPELFYNDDSQSASAVASTPDQKLRFEVIDNYAISEGDIVLGRANWLLDGTSNAETRGLARDSKLDRWPNGIVYYEIDNELTQDRVDEIHTAIDFWNAVSSLSLLPRPTDNLAGYPDYVRFEVANGCASWVGRIGGEQSLWVGPSCHAGSIAHEIGHAIGLFHEHTRIDRDNFITINWDNITAGKEFNFDIVQSGVSTIGDYDYDSLMHYSNYYFSKNGLQTISVPDGVTIGQRNHLSDKDLAAVNSLYETDLSVVTQIEDGPNTSTLTATATNNGDLGAHDISFHHVLPTGAVLVSTDGLWSCTTNSINAMNILSCSLDLLPAAEASALSVVVQTDSVLLDEHVLVSKTHDFDKSNNGGLDYSLIDTREEPPNEIVSSQNDPELGALTEEPIDTSGETGEQTDPGEGTNSGAITVDNEGNEETDGSAVGSDNDSSDQSNPSSGGATASGPESGAAHGESAGGGGMVGFVWLILMPFYFLLIRDTPKLNPGHPEIESER